MFAGRTAAETASLVPLLYSVCAKAQSLACITALEQAGGVAVAPTVLTCRRLAVAVETVREHLWRILLDWPRFAGDAPDPEDTSRIMSLAKEFFAAIDPDGALFRIGGPDAAPPRDRLDALIAEIDALVERRILGISASVWRERITGGGHFDHWCQMVENASTRLMRDLIASGEAGMGQSEVAPLPGIADEALIARVLAPTGAEFIARPAWDGAARETNPFSRRADSPLMRDLIGRFGNGILPRLTAQLLDVIDLLAEIRAEIPHLTSPEPLPWRSPVGTGIGRARAARGLLVHVVQTADDRVRQYRILAPTEWNFHPDGAAALGLAALPDAEDAILMRRAELLITAIDPCVAYDLTLAASPVSTDSPSPIIATRPRPCA